MDAIADPTRRPRTHHKVKEMDGTTGKHLCVLELAVRDEELNLAKGVVALRSETVRPTN